MATRTDVYRVTSKASLAGLKSAITQIKRMGGSITNLAKRANAAGGKIVRVTFNLKNLGKVAGGAVRGLGALARGFGALLAGGLLAVVGILRGLPGAFGAMREAIEGADAAVSGAGSSFEDTAEAASAAGEQMGETASAAVDAAGQIEGAFGAIGKVGEGFIQAQAKIFGKTADIAEDAIEKAQDASEAMEDYEDAVGGAVKSTSRFGSALDRIGSAWDRAKTKILQAIAKAITPALEALAKLMESPEFEAFVELIAKDMAEAAAKLADWFITKAIPAIQEFMDKVTEAGGPIEFIKEKWAELKVRALMVLAIIVGKALIVSNSIRRFFGRAISSVKSIFESLKIVVKATFNWILNAVEKTINAAIRVINPFISLYNAVAGATGGRKLDTIGRVSLPRLQRGGIATSPIAAIVGDAPSPEVIAPLDDLVDILRNLNIGGPSIGTVQVVVNADPGGLPLDQAGGVAADSFIREMRARGIQFAAR